MAWMMDTLSMHRGHTVAASVIGKPMAIGGTRGRRSATARGALRCIAAATKAGGRELAGARVAIQGFGRVGMTLAEELDRAGAVVVGIADDRDAALNPKGISVERAVEWMREHDAIRELPGAEQAPKEELFAPGCRHPRAGRPAGRDHRGQRQRDQCGPSLPRWQTAAPRRPPTRSSPTAA